MEGHHRIYMDDKLPLENQSLSLIIHLKHLDLDSYMYAVRTITRWSAVRSTCRGADSKNPFLMHVLQSGIVLGWVYCLCTQWSAKKHHSVTCISDLANWALSQVILMILRSCPGGLPHNALGQVTRWHLGTWCLSTWLGDLAGTQPSTISDWYKRVSRENKIFDLIPPTSITFVHWCKKIVKLMSSEQKI